uniref:Uncharacterized protein n=1 Tax=Strombidium rassoulzadegani TaxID=1082188 RepID=A0A7S3CK85_9SPIT|mmetsp:Transcript_1189/g.2177  ORF Transcript_1189/g.2177 Transcript_1189/m.2177 type:complete len:107 (-) Transcript_1189:32-352(-)|eukprot:CAMPEP_0168607918 /NCGR_PEP_ID=MMETSP0449_2-20121227/339_1 /TAXON_ID=1082188 /ORGANISM="Strombidium rassoulzadegani, Strain ras09" /LENGTH=106 /DNA_ID=CAMNT_0008647847 /DNA_START=33 /DNA_END=353 /DNA_ORIENTATION=+
MGFNYQKTKIDDLQRYKDQKHDKINEHITSHTSKHDKYNEKDHKKHIGNIVGGNTDSFGDVVNENGHLAIKLLNLDSIGLDSLYDLQDLQNIQVVPVQVLSASDYY